MPCLASAAKRLLDSTTDAEFEHSVYFAEGFLRCWYQVELLKNSFAELDDTLTNEPSNSDLFRAGYQQQLLEADFPYKKVLAEFMPESNEGASEHLDDPSS